MLREGLHYMAGNERMRRAAVHNPIARRMASRFVAGETLALGLEAVRRTNEDGMRAILDELGENVTSRHEAEAATDAYCLALTGLHDNKLDANVSCKLTHIGLDLGEDVARELTTRMVAKAAEYQNFLRIDMEGSKYTQVTIDLTKEIFAQYEGCVGTVIQSYLYRSADDVRELNRLGIRVRLVKGAYLEPPSIAFPQKKDVDDNYRRLAEMLLSEGTFPAFATHDEAIIEFVKDAASRLGRKASDFEFQMLYGVRRDLHRKLRDEGFGMRLYIPYGTQWYPYLMRRMAERPANLFFILGNMAREARAN